MAERFGGKNVQSTVFYVSCVFICGFATLGVSTALLIAAMVWAGIITP